MVDTFQPLLATEHARAVEDGGYNQSWIRAEDHGVME
jgi:hypothetical protein